MAIIYTYPIKTNPVIQDLVVITDSENKNFTKQTSLQAILELIDCSKLESDCGFCTTSISNVTLPGGTIISASDCGDGIEFTSSGGTVAISSPGGNVINLEAVGGGGGGGCTAAYNTINGTSGSISTANCGTPAVFTVDSNTNMTIQEDTGTLKWTLGCATTTERGGIIVGAVNNPASLESATTDANRSYPVQVNEFCTAFVNVPWIEGGAGVTYDLGTAADAGNGIVNLTGSDGSVDTVTFTGAGTVSVSSDPAGNVTITGAGGGGCSDVWKTITDPSANVLTASGCDDNIDFEVEAGSKLTIVGDPVTKSLRFGLGCATTALRGGIKIGAVDAEADPDVGPAEGLPIAVEVNNDCEAFVRVPTGSLVPAKGTWTPCLVTQGTDGTSVPLTKLSEPVYSAQEGTWHVINEQVYLDFHLEFTLDEEVGAISNSLGVAAVDAGGSMVGLNEIDPALANLNVKSTNNAYVGITEALTQGDANTWNIAPHAGKLNHYYNFQSGSKSVMWLYYWENPTGLAAAPLFTQYSPAGNWVNPGPQPTQTLAGSCNAILLEEETEFFFKGCKDSEWNSQSLPYPVASGISGPGVYWSEDPGSTLGSPTCIEVTSVDPGGSTPGLIDTAYNYLALSNGEEDECDCCGEYFHYQLCPYDPGSPCDAAIPTYAIIASTMLAAESTDFRTVKIDDCCYSLIINECEGGPEGSNVLFPDNGGYPVLDLAAVTLIGVSADIEPACENEACD